MDRAAYSCPNLSPWRLSRVTVGCITRNWWRNNPAATVYYFSRAFLGFALYSAYSFWNYKQFKEGNLKIVEKIFS